MPCIPLKSTELTEQHSVSIFGVATRVAWYKFHVGFLLGLFLDHEDESDKFLRSVGCISTDYTALYPVRYVPWHFCYLHKRTKTFIISVLIHQISNSEAPGRVENRLFHMYFWLMKNLAIGFNQMRALHEAGCVDWMVMGVQSQKGTCKYTS
jgi:hypothetical protein